MESETTSVIKNGNPLTAAMYPPIDASEAEVISVRVK